MKWDDVKQQIDDAIAEECAGFCAQDVEIDYIDFWEDITSIEISYDNFENKPHLRIT
jgi:hypothetical protein